MGIAPCISNILQKCNVVEDPDADPDPQTGIVPDDVGPADPGLDEHHFVPAGATIPANLAALIALGSLTQTVAWNQGEYVVLGDASHAHWSGVTWQAGDAP